MKLIWIAVLCVSVFCVDSAFADIYVFEDENGVYHFTDIPTHSGYTLALKTSPSPQQKTFYQYGENALAANRYSPGEIRKKIIASARKNDLDPALITAIITVESGFDPGAVSKKGAIGLMQLMPETAREFMVENPFDALQNIEGGIRYLKKLHTLYKGNFDYILAAYNAGEKAVYNYKGIPPYKETRNYVNKVKRFYKENTGKTL